MNPTQPGISQPQTDASQVQSGMYPQSQMDKTQFAMPTQMPVSKEVISSDYDSTINPYTGDMPRFSGGGLDQYQYARGGNVGIANQQKREIPASQIILHDQFSKEDGPEHVVQWISDHVNQGDGILVRKNNTVLFILRIAPATVEVHIYTLDNPLPLASAIKYFHNQLLNADIHTVYGTTPRSPQIINLMKAVGINVLPSDNPKYHWMAHV
jgi:hypothetical protein